MNKSLHKSGKVREPMGKACVKLGVFKDISGSWNCNMLDKGSREGENWSGPAHRSDFFFKKYLD